MRTVIACGALVALISCGGNGPDVDTTQDNVCDQIAEVACFDMYQCCSEGDIERALGVSDPRTQAECQTDLASQCRREAEAADLAFSVKKKHVKFDSKIMNDCLKAYVAPSDTCVTVEAMKPWTRACMTSAWTGLVAAGGECDFTHDCVKDAFCGPSRTCVALATEGMPCPAGQACATGLFCDTTMLASPVCHARLGAGVACVTTGQCQKDLFCDTSAPTGSHTCTPLLANGQTCATSPDCTSTLCLPGTCSNTGLACQNGVCAGTCANASTVSCTTDSTCSGGVGTCSGTTTSCFFANDPTCVAPSVCVFPNKCNLGTCMGRACADNNMAIDYCEVGSKELVPAGSQVVIGAGTL